MGVKAGQRQVQGEQANYTPYYPVHPVRPVHPSRAPLTPPSYHYYTTEPSRSYTQLTPLHSPTLPPNPLPMLTKAWRRRYCVFEPRRCVFTYYGSKESAEANATPKGSVEVTRAARGDAHNAGEDSRHGFRFNTSEGRIFECAVEGTNAQAEIDE